MFHPSQRSGIFGWYLFGPLLGPTIGPLLGGIIVESLGWRWLFGFLAIVCTVNTIIGYVFLRESYAPTILEHRKRKYEENDGGVYRIVGQDDRPFSTKLADSMQRPLKILFTQPIVFTMATWQAILFGTTYSLYTNFQGIYGDMYGFSTTQVGLMYLGPGVGYFFAVWFIVPKIDTIYNNLTGRNNDKPKPEFRLPLANIGAVLIPTSLFWFAWTVQYGLHWFIPLLSTVFFGIGQITILNTVQNYYIDSFEKYAASAIAAGAVFRSILGGVAPIFATKAFENLGYGWGVSIFGFLSLMLSPAPLLFIFFGERIRTRVTFEQDGNLTLKLEGITTRLTPREGSGDLQEADIVSCFLQAVLDAGHQIDTTGDGTVLVKSAQLPHGPRWKHGQAELAIYPKSRLHWSTLPVMTRSIYGNFLRNNTWHEISFVIFDSDRRTLGGGTLLHYNGKPTGPLSVVQNGEVSKRASWPLEEGSLGAPRDPTNVPIPHVAALSVEFSHFGRAPLPAITALRLLFKASIGIIRHLTGGPNGFNPPITRNEDWTEWPLYFTFYPEPGDHLRYGDLAEIVSAMVDFGQRWGFLPLDYTALHGRTEHIGTGLMRHIGG
ncbi:MAG: hypothetical protein LQ351_003300 [Letrouitia transgressa]|nr:MAG: hypothetical protein LQ351_003300 [Letrouitia transgressa]